MSKLVTKENHLLIAPSIACAIGLNESIILQQLHYWLDPRTNQNLYEEKFWVYNTYEQWLKQFPFWSITTIKRTIISLEQKEIIITSSFNKDKFNRTKWYSINYEVLDLFINRVSRLDQNDLSVVSKRPDSRIILTQSYKETEITTKTTTKNTLSYLSNDRHENVYNSKTRVYERENKILNIWNKVVEEDRGVTVKPTDKRLFLLNLKLKEFFNNDMILWEEFCRKITSSKFLMGELTGFRAQLDWVLKEENILRIIENSYGAGDRVVKCSNDNVEIIEENIIDPIWLKTRDKLEQHLGTNTFNSWIKKLRFQAICNQELYLIAPTLFIKDWILNNYSEDIKNKFSSCGVKIEEVYIQLA